MTLETLQLIIEYANDEFPHGINEEQEKKISGLGKIKYRLPMIHSYVIEIPASAVSSLYGMEGIKAVHQNAHITAQMNTARKIVKADTAHTRGFNGRGVGIAVLDTGVAPVSDLTSPQNRIAAFKDMINGLEEPYDDNGHGTHVAGIAAGNGFCSGGKYMGIAPECHIIAVKILDGEGRGNSADVLAGLQWLLDNRKRLNIRIANLSIGTSDYGSNRDPLVKAVEALWDAGIVITIAAGNNGPHPGSVTSPGTSRKVITVGTDDTSVQFSGRGPTMECIVKPDITAPGANIISCLTPTPSRDKIATAGNLKIISENYMQLSGTSMSTPVVTGAVALLLQKHPDLMPDDVKFMLKKSAVSMDCPKNQQGWGRIDIGKLLSEEAVYVRK